METTDTSRDTRRKRKRNRSRMIDGVKTGGTLMMYLGSAGLINPMIQKARENQSGAMSLCSIGAGTVISLGVGAFASKLFNKFVDKAVDFWDDVKPKQDETTEEGDEDVGKQQ